MGAIVEIGEVACANPHGPDAQPHLGGVDAVEIHQLFQGLPQRLGVVKAGRRRAARAQQEGRRDSGREEAGRASDEGAGGAQRGGPPGEGIGPGPFDREVHGSERLIGLGDYLPKAPQLLHAVGGRIAGDQGGVDRSDRDAGHPVRMQIPLGQRLIDAPLIGAQGAAALEQQSNAVERRPGESRVGRMGG